MRTFAVLAIFAIAMIAIENIPNEIAGTIGLTLIIATLIALIATIINIGRNAR
jgi:F0F1-type ATP synthase assembly protein I